MDTIASALSRFGAWLIGWITYIVGYALGSINAMLEYFLGLLRYLFELIMYPFISLLESIVGGLGLGSIVPLFNSLWNSGLGFFAEVFMLDVGLVAVLTAYLAKFLIRRLPFIG